MPAEHGAGRGYDLKVFFGVVDKAPAEVRATDSPLRAARSMFRGGGRGEFRVSPIGRKGSPERLAIASSVYRMGIVAVMSTSRTLLALLESEPAHGYSPVSYTHLTLPTICSV